MATRSSAAPTTTPASSCLSAAGCRRSSTDPYHRVSRDLGNQAGDVATSPAFFHHSAMPRHRFLPCLALLLLSAVAVAQAAPARAPGLPTRRRHGWPATATSDSSNCRKASRCWCVSAASSTAARSSQFDAQSLRIRFPDGIVELSLEGSGKPQARGGRTRRRRGVGRRAGARDPARSGRRRAAGRDWTKRIGPPMSAALRRSGPAPERAAGGHAALRAAARPARRRTRGRRERDARSPRPSAAISTVETRWPRACPRASICETPDGMKRVYLMPAATPDGTAEHKKR